MIYFLKWKMKTALDERNIARLGELLDKGADVNMDLGSGETPLHVAANDGAKDLVKFLISRGANVNALKQYNWAPIHDAAYRGKFDAVVELLKAGADPNLRTEEGKTAYGWAVLRKHPEVAEILSPYMKKSVEIAQEQSLKSPAPETAPGQGWTLLSESQIARSQTHEQLGYRLTDIFNFRDRERLRIVHNLETKADQAASLSFDDISDKSQLEDARIQLIRLGGDAPEETVTRLHKLPPPRQGR
ncbi:MAG: ankyrin repeat domain-containing protein [Alphaproteobacteria bacterium]|nr:MAG: ankyrin repeat domain-containing protein [Alphaproteobacteria bacterium]